MWCQGFKLGSAICKANTLASVYLSFCLYLLTPDKLVTVAINVTEKWSLQLSIKCCSGLRGAETAILFLKLIT